MIDKRLSLIERPSPNHGPRKGCSSPDLVILHYTAMESCVAALDRLCDPDHEVSAHYLISREGKIFAMVSECRRAWHAGHSYWQGTTDINSRSIGIELDYPGSLSDYPPFPEAQMNALETLLGDIFKRWSILSSSVLGHSDIAPSRKADPGAKFDWTRLAKAGFAKGHENPKSVQPNSRLSPLDQFIFDLEKIGYDPRSSSKDLLNAFRLRWRQGHLGPLDDIDLMLAHTLVCA